MPSNTKTSVHLDVLQQLKQHLKSTFPECDTVYFFGSQLIQPDDTSDYDLLLVFDRPIDWKFENEVLDHLYGESLKYNMVLDAKIYAKSTFESSLYQSMPFISQVIKTGIRL